MRILAAMYAIRLATLADVPALERLIAASARALLAPYYSLDAIEGALQTVFGVDTQLIGDATYFVAESSTTIVGCGGWSKRRTLFGSDEIANRNDALLDPAREPAKLRAFFTDPAFARTGVGRAILHACELAAAAAGFARFELVATRGGEPLYLAAAFAPAERFEVPLPNGAVLPVIRMTRTVAG
jgi:GNAT superfamily N-acetyltransferase